VLELTSRALEALKAADAAAKRFNPEARIRLARSATGVRADLVDELEPGDTVLDIDDLTLAVQDGLEGRVDAGEHQALTLEPLFP
jgi:hypothetical protein